jgi:hypothetical protein
MHNKNKNAFRAKKDDTSRVNTNIKRDDTSRIKMQKDGTSKTKNGTTKKLKFLGCL